MNQGKKHVKMSNFTYGRYIEQNKEKMESKVPSLGRDLNFKPKT